MAGPPEGTYALRIVTIGKDMGVGGMYATQREFGSPITVAAQVPPNFEYQRWNIKLTGLGAKTYYIENAHPYPPGVQLTGFYNHSLADKGLVTLDQPKEFTIESVGDVPFGEDVYIIRPVVDRPVGVDVCVGVEETTVVTKDIPFPDPLEARPGWHFYRRD